MVTYAILLCGYFSASKSLEDNGLFRSFLGILRGISKRNSGDAVVLVTTPKKAVSHGNR